MFHGLHERFSHAVTLQEPYLRGDRPALQISAISYFRGVHLPADSRANPDLLQKFTPLTEIEVREAI